MTNNFLFNIDFKKEELDKITDPREWTYTLFQQHQCFLPAFTDDLNSLLQPSEISNDTLIMESIPNKSPEKILEDSNPSEEFEIQNFTITEESKPILTPSEKIEIYIKNYKNKEKIPEDCLQCIEEQIGSVINILHKEYIKPKKYKDIAIIWVFLFKNIPNSTKIQFINQNDIIIKIFTTGKTFNYEIQPHYFIIAQILIMLFNINLFIDTFNTSTEEIRLFLFNSIENWRMEMEKIKDITLWQSYLNHLKGGPKQNFDRIIEFQESWNINLFNILKLEKFSRNKEIKLILKNIVNDISNAENCKLTINSNTMDLEFQIKNKSRKHSFDLKYVVFIKLLFIVNRPDLYVTVFEDLIIDPDKTLKQWISDF
jgi:hypothetical protein